MRFDWLYMIYEYGWVMIDWCGLKLPHFISSPVASENSAMATRRTRKLLNVKERKSKFAARQTTRAEILHVEEEG
jgi:hypothetical protein